MDHPLADHVALPDDLLFMEVLVRLPVNRLVRFKRVCRSWRARIEDAAFVRRHRDFSRAAPPSILVTPRKYSIDELSEDITFYCLRPGQTAGAASRPGQSCCSKRPRAREVSPRGSTPRTAMAWSPSRPPPTGYSCVTRPPGSSSRCRPAART
jgi:hypothetical protein